MSVPATAEIAQALGRLDTYAVEAKRLEGQSRRLARETRQTIDSLRRACDELGITLITDTDLGGHSHARTSP